MNEDKKKAVTFLKTCKGQIDGIINMIEEGRYCIDISNQLLAAGALVKKSNKLILAQHMEHCVHAAMNDEGAKEQKLKEITEIINKLLD